MDFKQRRNGSQIGLIKIRKQVFILMKILMKIFFFKKEIQNYRVTHTPIESRIFSELDNGFRANYERKLEA